jgi:hypothetical protein
MPTAHPYLVAVFSADAIWLIAPGRSLRYPTFALPRFFSPLFPSARFTTLISLMSGLRTLKSTSMPTLAITFRSLKAVSIPRRRTPMSTPEKVEVVVRALEV